MKVVQHINSVFSSNTYILDNGEQGIYVVDPGDYDCIAAYLAANGKKPSAVLLTHAHYDHIYGLPKMLEDNPNLKVYTSANGIEALASPSINFSKYHEDPISIQGASIEAVSDGDSIALWPGIDAKAIATPGHNYTSLSFAIGDYLFTGDSYIPGVKVVTSLPKSDKGTAAANEAMLMDLALCEELIVAPGHGNMLAPEGKALDGLFM